MRPFEKYPDVSQVVWSFPVLPSYTLTHSWARELKRWGRTSLCTVAFKIPDDELVLVNHYSRAPLEVAASEAVGLILNAGDPRGYQIAVTHRVLPKDIVRVSDLPKAIGWRYWPEAKNLPMQLCDCPVCSPRGEVKAAKYRAHVRKAMTRAGIESTRGSF